jgi:hypothetical protein
MGALVVGIFKTDKTKNDVWKIQWNNK